MQEPGVYGGEKSRLEPKNDPTAELTLMGVLVIAHNPALPGPIGAAPNSTRIGFNVGWCPAGLELEANSGTGKEFYPSTPGRGEFGHGFHLP